MFQGGGPFATVNTETNGEFDMDFDEEDMSDGEDQILASSFTLGPSHSQATFARFAKRLRCKSAHQTV